MRPGAQVLWQNSRAPEVGAIYWKAWAEPFSGPSTCDLCLLRSIKLRGTINPAGNSTVSRFSSHHVHCSLTSRVEKELWGLPGGGGEGRWQFMEVPFTSCVLGLWAWFQGGPTAQKREPEPTDQPLLYVPYSIPAELMFVKGPQTECTVFTHWWVSCLTAARLPLDSGYRNRASSTVTSPQEVGGNGALFLSPVHFQTDMYVCVSMYICVYIVPFQTKVL